MDDLQNFRAAPKIGIINYPLELAKQKLGHGSPLGLGKLLDFRLDVRRKVSTDKKWLGFVTVFLVHVYHPFILRNEPEI